MDGVDNHDQWELLGLITDTASRNRFSGDSIQLGESLFMHWYNELGDLDQQIVRQEVFGRAALYYALEMQILGFGEGVEWT